MATFTVLGCGAWATTVAKMLGENGHQVWIKCHRDAYVRSIQERHENQLSLPGVPLPVSVRATLSFDSIEESDAIILGVPSVYLSDMMPLLPPLNQKPVLSLIKGVLPGKDWQPSRYFSTYSDSPFAVLSGPNLASEIAKHLPAATVIACQNQAIAHFFQQHLSRPYFRAYVSGDVIGVELGGILKNIMAIAAGICDGHEWGLNAKASLLTRAMREIVSFGRHFGAQEETFFGLSCLGDLMATCHSQSSRNWRLGFQLSQGITAAEISLGNAIPEGQRTTQLLFQIANDHQLSMPILTQVYGILSGTISAKAALTSLMSRTLTEE